MLKWIDYWFPVAELRDTSAYPPHAAPAPTISSSPSEQPATAAPPAASQSSKDVLHPKEDVIQGRLQVVQSNIDAAAKAQDFLLAAKHKGEKENLQHELAMLLS